MARALERLFIFVSFCVAATGIAAASALGAERPALQGALGGQPATSPVITLELPRDAALLRPLHPARAAAPGRAGEARIFVTAFGGAGGGKALRIDLFRFEVTRAPADIGAANLAGAFPPSVVRIGVTEGAMPRSKAVGIAMHLAPNLVLESRLGPAGASDTALRFKLRF